MKFVVTSQAGLALGEYDERAPIIRLEQGRPHPRMKRPLDLAPGDETVVDYPLEGAYRTLTATVRRVDETDAEQPRPSPAPSRPRVVEVEQPARNVTPLPARSVPVMPITGAVVDRDPKPPAKVEAPPVSATRRRVVRKTP